MITVRTNTIMGMARTPHNGGYWEVGTDGGVFAFGDAGFYNSLPSRGIHVRLSIAEWAGIGCVAAASAGAAASTRTASVPAVEN